MDDKSASFIIITVNITRDSSVGTSRVGLKDFLEKILKNFILVYFEKLGGGIYGRFLGIIDRCTDKIDRIDKFPWYSLT